MTFDDKPAFKEKHAVTIPVEYSNVASLMLHMEICSGEHKGEKFRFIGSVCNGGFRLEFRNHHLDINTRDLVSCLMDKIQELQAIKNQNEKGDTNGKAGDKKSRTRAGNRKQPAKPLR